MASGLAAGKTQMQAYRDAGFTGKAVQSAADVAARPELKTRVNEIIATQHRQEIRSSERAIEKAAIDKAWVVSRAQYIVEFGIRGQPIMDDQGKATGRYAVKPNLGAATASLELLARMGGFLVEKVEIGGPGDFARMADEELNNELLEIGMRIGLPKAELLKIAGPMKEKT